jgi:hypothetical protein
MRSKLDTKLWRELEQLVRKNLSLLERELKNCKFSGYQPNSSKEVLELLALAPLYKQGYFEKKIVSGWKQELVFRSPKGEFFLLGVIDLKQEPYLPLRAVAILNLGIALFEAGLLPEKEHKRLGDLIGRGIWDLSLLLS